MDSLQEADVLGQHTCGSKAVQEWWTSAVQCSPGLRLLGTDGTECMTDGFQRTVPAAAFSSTDKPRKPGSGGGCVCSLIANRVSLFPF